MKSLNFDELVKLSSEELDQYRIHAAMNAIKVSSGKRRGKLYQLQQDINQVIEDNKGNADPLHTSVLLSQLINSNMDDLKVALNKLAEEMELTASNLRDT